LYHSTLGLRVIKKKKKKALEADRVEKQLFGRVHVEGVQEAHEARETFVPRELRPHVCREREFFIHDLLVRIHFIIVMIRWTGLAPCEFEFLFPGGLTFTYLAG